MITRPYALALVMACYLLVAGTFVFFAVRIQTVRNFLERIEANQVEIINHVRNHESHMDEDRMLLKKVLGQCSR